MSSYAESALSVDIAPAVIATRCAAVNEANSQADRLLGGAPTPGTREWETLYSADGDGAQRDGVQRDRAVGLVQLRIELATGIDATETVIGLRRWGVTWAQIAAAADTSRQAAHARWSARVAEVLDRYGTGELGGPVADDETDLQG